MNDTVRHIAPATAAFLLLYAALGVPLVRHVDPSGVGALATLVLALALAVLSAIDLHYTRLPDAFTLPLAALGLVVSWWNGVAPLWWPVASAALGFGLFYAVAFAYHYVRGRAGLGLGDAKLLAVSGAWLGAEALPTVLLWATLSALVCVVVAAWRGGAVSAATRLPFGPFLAFATWLVWLYGPL